MSVVAPPERIRELQEGWIRAARVSDAVARAAAGRALRGASDATKVLLKNLGKLDYPEVRGVRPPPKRIEDRLAKLRGALGAAPPPALTLFWETVGGISLVDLTAYQHVGFWKRRGVTGPAGFSDGVHIDRCSKGWVRFVCQDHDDLRSDPAGAPRGPYAIPISPDGYHKDNLSGGPTYGMAIGGGWLAPILDFEWSGSRRPLSAPEGPPDLIGYLRTALLECAGFPALYGSDSFEPVRIQLLDGVAPF